MNSFLDLALDFVARLKVPARVVVTLAVVLAGALFLYFKPQEIEISGPLILSLHPGETALVIKFTDFVLYDRYSLYSQNESGKEKRLRTSESSGVAQETFAVTVDNAGGSKAEKAKVLKLYLVKQWPPPLVNQVFVHGRQIDPNDLRDRLEGTDFEFRQWRSMREILSVFLTKYNDAIADHVLAFSFAFLVYLIVFRYSIIRYVIFRINHSSDPKKYVYERYRSPDSSSILELVESRWDKQGLFASIVEVVGPSLGFLFTVTSLISALAPLGGDAPALAEFLNAIRIALVSTFLGLTARIVAIFIQRANDEVFVLECQALRSN